MSIKANNWCWQDAPREINGNPFTVLQAIADWCDDDGNMIYADRESRGQEAIAWKARVSRSTFQRAIVYLSNLGVMSVTRSGRENNYKLNLDAFVDGNRRQSDLCITPEVIGVNLTTVVTVDASDASTVTHSRNVLNEDLKIQSDLEVTTEARALRADGDVSQPRLGIADRLRSAGARRHLNIVALNDRVEQYFDDVAGHENVRRIVYLVAKRILAKAAYAKTELVDPTKYVVTAIEAEPEVWRKYAFTLDPRA